MRETEILVEQGAIIGDHAGLVIDKFHLHGGVVPAEHGGFVQGRPPHVVRRVHVCAQLPCRISGISSRVSGISSRVSGINSRVS